MNRRVRILTTDFAEDTDNKMTENAIKFFENLIRAFREIRG